MPFKLFVSYSEKDRSRIEPLLFCIRNMPEKSNGLLDLFFYEVSRTPSANTTDEIIERIRCSDAVLYFHSKNSVLSEFVQNEIGGAVVAGKQVIIAKLDKTRVKGMLKGVNYLNFANPDIFEREMKALLDTVKAKIDSMQEQEAAKASLAPEEVVVRRKSTFAQNSAESGLISKRKQLAIQPSYTIEDWKMILAIAAVITLAVFILRTSKQSG